MDFTLTEEQKMLQATIRDFAINQLAKIADELDRKQEFAWDNFRMMAELGLFGLTTPPEFGGSGGGEISVAVVTEEIAYACAATADILDAHLCLCTAPIYHYGNDAQRKRLLPALIKGERIGAFAITEAEAGSDIGNIKSTAVKDGDAYILNGTKLFITNGDVCDTVVFFANIPALGKRGMTAFIVEKEMSGFSKGKKYDKLGMRAATNAEIVLTDCRVPVANRLGEEGQGMRMCLEILDHGRIGISAQALGITRAVLTKAVEYAKQRVQFGVPIGQNQGIAWKLADIATEFEAARLLTYQAATLADQGARFGKEAAMAKLYTTELAMRAATAGIQIFGGYGYMMDSSMQRYFRDAKLTEIYEGTSEIQRIVIARAVMS